MKSQHGLTTSQAPFIENARSNGDIFIQQPYELYNEDNQDAWRKLYALLQPKWEKYANVKFLEGIRMLRLNPRRIPRLEEINQFLAPLTGFQAKAVSGYVPSYIFFDCLKERAFPTTITIRDSQRLHYLPEPDIFHDIAGHVPMHTDRTFADVLAAFGSLASLAAHRHSSLTNVEERNERIGSNIQALSRFFWFTIEFGLLREKNRLSVYGSGLLSSSDEIEKAIESSDVQRHPFQLEWVINQSFEIDRFQPLLFIIDSFEHLYQEVQRLQTWLVQGKLDHVSSGEPKINGDDLKAFLNFNSINSHKEEREW